MKDLLMISKKLNKYVKNLILIILIKIVELKSQCEHMREANKLYRIKLTH